MHAEALAVMLDVTADFVFNRLDMEILRIIVFGTYHGASVITCRAFDWKSSSIFMLNVEAVPQKCIP
jgi:hypothetical protein